MGGGAIAVLSVVVILFSGQLAGLFVESAGVAEIVAGFFKIVSVGYVMYMLTSCYLGVLSGMGTSYHYAGASDEISVNGKYLGLFRELLEELHVTYTVGKVWTTDGFYRETQDKVNRRKAQGCICVDMECSANEAVARFRGRELIQFFYAADNLDAEQWDKRSLSNYDRLEEKDRIAAVALELARRIENFSN